MIVTPRMLFALALVLPPVAASAASDCFCLQDEAMNIRYGCSTQQQGFRSRTFCLDESSREFTVDEPDAWTKLEEGQGRCDPCRPTRSLEGPIRTGDEGDGDPDTNSAGATAESSEAPGDE